jgi:ATP-dependent DNA helicase RecQ
MLYTYADMRKHEYFIEQMKAKEQKVSREKIDTVLDYCALKRCRRHFLLTYFNDPAPASSCDACDVCVVPTRTEETEVPFAETTLSEEISQYGSKLSTFSNSKSTAVNPGLFEALRRLRTEEAARLGLPPYMIFGDKALHDMVKKLPQSPTEFLAVNGVGEQKLKQFGAKFMKVIRERSG